jgi:hypothetical protein
MDQASALEKRAPLLPLAATTNFDGFDTDQCLNCANQGGFRPIYG